MEKGHDYSGHMASNMDLTVYIGFGDFFMPSATVPVLVVSDLQLQYVLIALCVRASWQSISSTR